MQFGLLGDQRQAETRARPRRRRCRGGTVSKTVRALLLGNAGAVVVDRDLDTVGRADAR